MRLNSSSSSMGSRYSSPSSPAVARRDNQLAVVLFQLLLGHHRNQRQIPLFALFQESTTSNSCSLPSSSTKVKISGPNSIGSDMTIIPFCSTDSACRLGTGKAEAPLTVYSLYRKIRRLSRGNDRFIPPCLQHYALDFTFAYWNFVDNQRRISTSSIPSWACSEVGRRICPPAGRSPDGCQAACPASGRWRRGPPEGRSSNSRPAPSDVSGAACFPQPPPPTAGQALPAPGASPRGSSPFQIVFCHSGIVIFHLGTKNKKTSGAFLKKVVWTMRWRTNRSSSPS